MGHMTVAMFLNDAEGNVKSNPEQVAKNVYEAMIGVGMHKANARDFPIGNHVNAMKAVSAQHTDIPQLVLAYQNDLVRLGYGSELTGVNDLDYRKRILEVAKQVIETEEQIIRELEEKEEV